MRNQQNVKVRVNSSFETICPFPIGYVYMSSNSTSPGSIYGGTWASISGGRYMRAANTWGNGGSNTITIQQMPAHTHSVIGFFKTYANVAGSGYATAPIDWDTLTTTSAGGGATVLSHLPKRLGVVQNCLKKVMLRA